MIIAIDGPSGSGKSTISKLLADRMSFSYLNSGDFYRILTFIALKHKDIAVGQELKEECYASYQQCVEMIEWGTNGIRGNLEKSSYFSSLQNITFSKDALHSPEVDEVVAQFSKVVPLRLAINDKIREICQEGLGWVVEGRDVTTQIFPRTPYKFYLDASLELRAVRRENDYKQNSYNKISIEKEKVSKMIEKRDLIDKNKGEFSLTISYDTVYVDTSNLSIDKVFDIVYNNIKTAEMRFEYKNGTSSPYEES